MKMTNDVEWVVEKDIHTSMCDTHTTDSTRNEEKDEEELEN